MWPSCLHEIFFPQAIQFSREEFACFQLSQPKEKFKMSYYQGLLHHRTCKTDFLCSWPSLNSYLKLDVDPQRDDDASPTSTHRWDLLECWFQLFSTSKIQFRTFLKKKSNFWFPCCGTREDLSVDVSITNVGLILTKPGRFLFSRTETRGTDRIQFRRFPTFWKKFTFLGFY